MDTLSLQLDRRDAGIYRQWARFMLGLERSTSCLAAADRLFARHGEAIERVAQALSTVVLPLVWGSEERVLYRGLRLDDPGLDGAPLPVVAKYAGLPAWSFSESREVARYFADPGGMPAVGNLPDHGYVATATVRAEDVLFHWRYVLGAPALVAAPGDDLPTVLAQQEVTVRARPGFTATLRRIA